ncbi:TPA: zinc ribbon domain-containing protein [Legionella pneumophila]|uniref:Nudix hydrolase N-terminal domain-containing protein n=1 Tax=Legionella pneumophila subsp. pneumophila TaxID=91891 RepID=A0A3A6VMW3_LEGPN|nr:hypothetical protein A9P84_01435 [Legionella pneumophila]ERB41627.1 hypothetical protein N748_08230 [Legionella pneumophila str. 121004]ERH44043.1 hypothetical protein N750_10340 [Legionella pneumophila str. Leg01/53]ERH46671.1 hypothetical protein N751_00150 [Legionella pneumophila str. Leg01/11]ERI48212.1 hypothetical protein N749_10980 [Legionella pneumophila str. Leg01/20]QOD88511.1 NUDIX hydrolase [Legionella pneumophila subsp. pneumophila]
MTKERDSNTDFCSQCGHQSIVFSTPPNDTRVRKVCNYCLTVHYQNPKIAFGTVTMFKDKFYYATVRLNCSWVYGFILLVFQKMVNL